jgi:S1-C subfamily serine protease
MNSQSFGFCAVTALAFAACMAGSPLRAAEVAPVAPAAPAAPVAPAPPAPRQPDIDAQLEAAQRQLEQAAHEVARLSTQMSTTVLEQVMPLMAGHVIIGVQLESTAANGGARVREVSPGGPAAEAGIRAGDVIVSINGTPVRGEGPSHQVSAILRDVKPDTPVSVVVQREGKALTFTVTARGTPEFLVGLPNVRDLNIELPEMLGRRPLRDMELATLTPRLGSYFGTEKGVLVVRAPADGALRLEDGDVILAIDGREPASGSQATRILGSYRAGEKLTLHIVRQRRTLDLETTLPEFPRSHETRHREADMPRAERLMRRTPSVASGAA